MRDKRKLPDRRRIIRRKEDRLLFQKEFVSIAESLAMLKESLQRIRQEGLNIAPNKEVAKLLGQMIDNIENQVLNLDQKISSLQSYWKAEME